MGRIEDEYPIEELELGVASYNVLKRMGVDDVGAFMGVTEADLEAWARENPSAVYNRRRVVVDVAGAQARVSLSRL